MKKSTWIGLCIAFNLVNCCGNGRLDIRSARVVPISQGSSFTKKGSSILLSRGKKVNYAGNLSATGCQPLKQMVSQGKRTTATAGETSCARLFFRFITDRSRARTLALAIWLEADGLYYSEATDTATHFLLAHEQRCNADSIGDTIYLRRYNGANRASNKALVRLESLCIPA